MTPCNALSDKDEMILQGCVGALSLLMVKAGGRNASADDHLQQVTSEFQHIAAIFCSQGPEVCIVFGSAIVIRCSCSLTI